METRERVELRLRLPAEVDAWLEQQSRRSFTSCSAYARSLLVAAYVRHKEQSNGKRP